jgi:hypothetical protein
MSNTILTPDVITREAQRILHSKAQFCGTITREYDSSFAKEGAKIGDTLRVRLPNKYTVSTGAALSTQDTTETKVSLDVSTQAHVDTVFTTDELTMDIDTFSQRILQPGISQLAAYIDNDALSMYNGIGPSVGTPGTAPTTILPFGQARAKLNQQATPIDNDRTSLVDSNVSATLVNGLKGLFQDSTQISRQYLEGMMGRTSGLDFYESDLLQTHTNGAFAGTVLIDDASIAHGQTEIGMDAFTDAAPTIKKGDVFTIAGVYDVHPETKKVYSHLKQFVVTADNTGSSNEITDVAFSPAINLTGAYQNINAIPVDGEAVTFIGTAETIYQNSLVYHKNAFTIATADLLMPDDVHFKSRVNFEGISMRILRQYTIADDKIPARIDVLYGYIKLSDTNREPQAVRVWG